MGRENCTCTPRHNFDQCASSVGTQVSGPPGARGGCGHSVHKRWEDECLHKCVGQHGTVPQDACVPCMCNFLTLSADGGHRFRFQVVIAKLAHPTYFMKNGLEGCVGCNTRLSIAFHLKWTVGAACAVPMFFLRARAGQAKSMAGNWR